MKPIERGTLFFLPALLLVLLFIRPIIDPDLFWHLKTGDFILENMGFTDRDPFSYTSTVEPLVNSYWVTHVIFSLLYRIGGFEAITIFVSLAVVGAFFLLWKLESSRKVPALFSTLFLLFIVADNVRFHLRPNAFTMLFSAVFVYLFENRKDSRRFYISVIALQILWTNMSSGYLLGILIIAAHSLEEMFPFSVKGLKKAIAFPLATLAATLINPWGPNLHVTQYNIMLNYKWVSVEWAPLMNAPVPPTIVLVSLGIIALLGLASLVMSYEKPRLDHASIFALMLASVIRARRFIELFPILSMPLILNAFNRKPFTSLKFNRIVMLALVLVHLGWFGYIFTGKYYKPDINNGQLGFGVLNAMSPVAAAEAVLKLDLKGNLFNNYEAGGYLIWRLSPERKVFVDGRAYPYEENFLKEAAEMLQSPAKFEEALAKYDFDLVILSHYPGRSLATAKYLYESTSWALLALDEGGSLFVRRGRENDKAIEAHTIDLANSSPITPQNKSKSRYPFAEINLADFYAALGYNELAITEFNAAIDVFPLAEVHYRLGMLYFQTNRQDLAKNELKKAISMLEKGKAPISKVIRMKKQLEFIEKGH